tara:strand:+ start:515 stop:739 length:225 start_codon:yes stop_codon:yes gene_type:complete
MGKPFVKEGRYYNVMAEAGGRIETQHFDTLDEIDDWLKSLQRPARVVVEEVTIKHRMMGTITIPASVQLKEAVH